MCRVLFRNWKLWIKPLLIFTYALFILIFVPILIYQKLQDGFNRTDQLLLVSSLFVLSALPVTIFHIMQHIINYNTPILQKHIIRILWMVPIYSLNGLLGLLYPQYSLYMDSVREVYEAYVIYNFMKYLLNYLNLEMDLQASMQFKPQVAHIFPLCWIRPWKMGNELVHNCKHGVLQYTIIRPLTTLISVICELFDVYKEGSFALNVAFPYIIFINNITQFIAMYCLVLFYKANKEELKPMKPLPKFLCIKAVVFFSFFQGVVISFLVYFEFIKNIFNSDIANDDYKLLSNRLQNFLICIEMFLAALAHKYSFPVSPFQINTTQMERSWYLSLLAMLDISDVRQDITEHFGIVGGRITRGFRGHTEYLSEREHLLPSQQASHSRYVMDKNTKKYGSDSSPQNQRAIGNRKNYNLAEISESKESDSKSDSNFEQSVQNTMSINDDPPTIDHTPSTADSEPKEDNDYYGISVKGNSVRDHINYRNPNV